MRNIRTQAELEDAIHRYGFLPMFRSVLHGFSVEEMTDARLWFAEGVEGPWEWKGPLVRSCRVVYGKLYGSKAMYVDRELYPDFANWRRASRPLPHTQGVSASAVLSLIESEGPMLSPDLKRCFEALPRRKRSSTDLVDLTGLGNVEYKANRNALERVLTHLQMAGRLVISNFEYPVSKAGHQYGWGLARYALPEQLYGADFMAACKGRTPEQSRSFLLGCLSSSLPPSVSDKAARLVD